jgi:ADP-ribosylation factor family
MLIAGRSGCGKTTYLYSHLLEKQPLENLHPAPAPTSTGYNNEVVEFNRWQRYDVWDVCGSDASRRAELWKKFYTRIEFDHVLYMIEIPNGRPNDCTDELEQDRIELLTMMNEPDLQKARFTVYVRQEGTFDNAMALDEDVLSAVEDMLHIPKTHDRVAVLSLEQDVRYSYGVRQPEPGYCCK